MCGGFDQHGRERRDGLAVEVWAGGGLIDVDVGDRLVAEFVGELLSPFGGTGEADFFSVPTADNDGAPRTYSLFRQLSQGAGQFHHRCGAAAGVDAAEDPGVAVIAEHDPFVGQLRAANAAFDHVVGLSGIVHLDLHVHAHALAAEVILDGQPALPVVGGDRAVHISEQGLGVVPGKRQRHDLRNRNCFLDGNALGAGNGGPSGGERIAGHHEVVSDGAALNVILGAPGAVGSDFALLVSVFGGIAVNKDGGRAFALGGERLETAIAVGIRVAHEHYLAFDVDALLAEQIVVFGIAAVSVDERGSDLAGRGHATPCGADAFVLQARIAGDGQLAQDGAVMNGRNHFKRSGFWIAAVNVVAADDDVFEAFGAPLVGDVASQFVVARGAGDVRFGGEEVMLAALFVGGGNGFEFVFDLSFVSGGRGSEAEDGSLGIRGQRCAEHERQTIQRIAIAGALRGISPCTPRLIG